MKAVVGTMVVNKKKLLFATVLVMGLVFIGLFWLNDKYTVPVLLYHQVNQSTEVRADTVSPSVFQWQMRYLRDRGYTVIPLEKLVAIINNRQPLPRRAVVLTFDDGYENNFTNAFPVLKSYSYPAMIFISAGLVGTPGLLTWDKIKEMQLSGISFGSHGMKHHYLPEVSDDLRREEIFASKKNIETQLGRCVDIYAYAVGGFNDNIQSMVRAAGYKAAMTTNRGYDRFNRSLYQMQRIKVTDRDRTSFVFWAKLSGYYNLFRSAKRPE